MLKPLFSISPLLTYQFLLLCPSILRSFPSPFLHYIFVLLSFFVIAISCLLFSSHSCCSICNYFLTFFHPSPKQFFFPSLPLISHSILDSLYFYIFLICLFPSFFLMQCLSCILSSLKCVIVTRAI